MHDVKWMWRSEGENAGSKRRLGLAAWAKNIGPRRGVRASVEAWNVRRSGEAPTITTTTLQSVSIALFDTSL